jgi:hypothetical protein
MEVSMFFAGLAAAIGFRGGALRRSQKCKIFMSICAAIVASLTVLTVEPSYAANVSYIAGSGNDANPCTASQPCKSFQSTLNVALQVLCTDPPFSSEGLVLPGGSAIELDCAGVWSAPSNQRAIEIPLSSQANTLKVRNMTFSGSGGGLNALFFLGPGGTVIFENCVFEDFASAALSFLPFGALNIVIKNSRLSNNGSGILLQPRTGGIINATLDHVTITGNNGGGIKTDSTNGLVNLDITDSEISNNAGNGTNAVAGANLNVVNIRNSVIAKNGAAGVQANGADAGVLVATTLLDENTAGATSIVGGGNMVTYGNNSIVGSIGSGFNGTATLH